MTSHIVHTSPEQYAARQWGSDDGEIPACDGGETRPGELLGPPIAARDRPAINTMDGYTRGPARGIVLALLPAVAIWAALFKLVARLLG